jgi:iron complex outermembrane receptor protein
MMDHKKQLKQFCLSLLALACAGTSLAQSADEDDLALAYGDQPVVSIATGRQQALSRAPATATVITVRDIQAMGATSLEQVLESVPGLHVAVSSLASNPIYSFRGIYTRYNPQVLMLVNGLPITNVFLGNRSLAWGGMPLENVQRIEVIRGPGSALYGADAFSGVINVITKTADDIKGTEFGARVGSFKSGDDWFQHGGSLGQVKAAFYLGLGRSDGQKNEVEADAQTGFDKLFNTSASLAPGSVNASRQNLDARTDLAYEHWRLRAAYQHREQGIGEGLAESLDPVSKVPESRTYLDLSYENPNWAPNWDVSAVTGYYVIQERPADPGYVLFPPGAFGGLFPQGMIGDPGHSERHAYFNWSAFYTGFNQHQLRFGAGFQDDDLYKTQEYKNFSQASGLTNLGGLIDVSGTSAVYLTPHRRDVTYELLQDEWSMAKDWTLTGGVRHDHYSDFGDTTNPRVALVWNAAYNVVVKALHGSAFRAPSFSEEYDINNPVTIGNPKLKPETIKTNELSGSWQASDTVQTSLTLFQYRWRDIINFVPEASAGGNVAENAGNQKGHGFELEGSWDATSSLRLKGSYSYQHSVDEATHEDAGLAPHRRMFAQADWGFAPLWRFGTTVNYVASRDRQPGDARPAIADYGTLDLTLAREKLFRNADLRMSVLNLFNRDAREPSLAPGNIPYDLPLPGRTFYVQLQYTL